MKYFIATSGITHAGKTTFGKDLKKKISNIPVLDSDELYELITDFIPEIKEIEKTITDVSAEKPRLRHRLFEKMIEFFLENNQTIICTNGNTTVAGRKKFRDIAFSLDAKFVLIYFNLSQEEINRRISETKRSKKIHTHSKSFEEVLEKQLQNFEPPSRTEADIYFEINNNGSYLSVLSRINQLIKNR